MRSATLPIVNSRQEAEMQKQKCSEGNSHTFSIAAGAAVADSQQQLQL